MLSIITPTRELGEGRLITSKCFTIGHRGIWLGVLNPPKFEKLVNAASPGVHKSGERSVYSKRWCTVFIADESLKIPV